MDLHDLFCQERDRLLCEHHQSVKGKRDAYLDADGKFHDASYPTFLEEIDPELRLLVHRMALLKRQTLG